MRPVAAPPHWPYHHRTLAQVDATLERDRERSRERRASQRRMRGGPMLAGGAL